MLYTKSLKLGQIVLDIRINSVERVVKTVLAAAKYSAHKCYILIMHMLEPDHLDVEMIGGAIDDSIDKLLSMVESHCSNGIFAFMPLSPQVVCLATLLKQLCNFRR